MIYEVYTQIRCRDKRRPAELGGLTMTIERWRPFGSIARWDPFRNISDIQGEVNRDLTDESNHHVERVYGKVRAECPASDACPGREGEGHVPRRGARGQASEGGRGEAEGNQDRYRLSRSHRSKW